MLVVYKIIDSGVLKLFISEDYNYAFNKVTGQFARWGKTREDDSQFSPFGPEIADIEISVDGCVGPGMELKNGSTGGPCRFCYKGNKATPPKNMSLDTFRAILDKMPKTLTQVAFGITTVQANPDFFAMMEYCREKDVVPNYTTAGADLTPEIVEKTAKLCGAVAVSVYEADKEVGYRAIRQFTDAGMTQVNIHAMISQESLNFVYEILDDIQIRPELAQLNAVVFLGLKPKGRARGQFNVVTQEQFNQLMDYCFMNNIRFGMDSCQSPRFFKFIENLDEKDQLVEAIEPCESFGLFSSYVNVEGRYFPCSFAEGEIGWEEGINLLEVDDFLEEVWFSDTITKLRISSLQQTKDCDCSFSSSCRICPFFDITPCKVFE